MNIVRKALLSAVIIIAYVILEKLGILNLLVPGRLAETGMSLGLFFLIGLLSSVHCIAMCGGISLSQCLPQSDNADFDCSGSHNAACQIRNKRIGSSLKGTCGLNALRPAILYNLGRVVSYTAVGFVLGFIGMLMGGGAEPTGSSVYFQGVLKMLAGIIMLFMGLNMLKLFPQLSVFIPRLPDHTAVKIFNLKASARQPFIVGLLNGLMPCGPLSAVQLAAFASASPITGALSMLMFSVGTVPLMLFLGSIVSILGRKSFRLIQPAGAMLIAVLGLAMLSQGVSLAGLLTSETLLMLIIIFFMLCLISSMKFVKKRHIAACTAFICICLILSSAGIIKIQLPPFYQTKAADKSLSEKDASQNASENSSYDSSDVQIINSTLSYYGYPSITVKAGIPVEWTINVPKGMLNGCNYRMYINEYDIEHTFTEGENVIEFIPDTAGTFQYTCWMGMQRGTIYVTDDTASQETADSGIAAEAEAGLPEASVNTAVPVFSGCCGGY